MKLIIFLALFSLSSVTATYIHSNATSTRLFSNTSSPSRSKRDTAEIMTDMYNRLKNVEDQVELSFETIGNLEGFLTAIGFLSKDTSSLPAEIDPCKGTQQSGSQDGDNNEWTAVGSNACVKVINGHHTYSEAVEICRQEMRQGEDIAYPEILQMDSKQKQNAILSFLRNRHPSITGVWIDLKNESNNDNYLSSNKLPARTNKDECTELTIRVPLRRSGAISDVTYVPWMNVDCGRTNSIVCERTVPVSYKTIVHNHLKHEEEVKKLSDRVKRIESDNQQLSLQIRSSRDDQDTVNIRHNEILSEVTAKVNDVQQWKGLIEAKGPGDLRRNEKFSKDLKALQDWKQRLDAQNAADSSKLEQCTERLDNLQEWKGSAEAKSREYGKQIERFVKDIQDLKQQGITSKIERGQLAERNGNLQSENEKLKGELSQLTNTVREMSAKLNAIDSFIKSTTRTTRATMYSITTSTPRPVRHVGTSKAIFKYDSPVTPTPYESKNSNENYME